MWQANTENFLKRIQKTTMPSTFVYGSGLNILGGGAVRKKENSPQASLSNTPFCQLALQVHELLAPLQAGAYVCASMMTLAPQPNYNKILLTGAMAPSMWNAFCLDHEFTLAQMLQVILSHKSS